MAKEKAHLPDAIRKVLKDKTKNPSTGEFVAEIIVLAGGPKALASIMWQEVIKPGASPMFKSRFLDTVLRAMQAEDKKNPDREISTLSDEELADYVSAYIEESATRKAGVTDAQPQ